MTEINAQNLPRLFNILQEGQKLERIKVSRQIFEFFKQNKNTNLDYENMMQQYLKILLENLSYNSDEVRENSCKIIHKIFPNSLRIHIYVPYIIEKLIELTNCIDLENQDHLPEKMKPTPEQKPFKMINLIEKVDEIRMQYTKLLRDILECCEEETILEYLQEIVMILRVFIMDPYINIQIKGCELTKIFVNEYRKYLENFGTVLLRSTLNPLVSKKSKLRIEGLKCIQELMYIGSFKKSVDSMDVLIGFQDPNFVRIKEFYSPTQNYNYLAMFINDPKINVREVFFSVLENWILQLPDREDHHGRLLPYLLSGLFDQSQIIQEQIIEVLEQIGIQIEREKEKKFREEKQLEIYPAWSYQGRMLDFCMFLNFKKRPRIGTRFLITNHVRKYIPGIVKELKQTLNFQIKLNDFKLLKFLIFLVEDNIEEFLDKILLTLIKSLKYDEKNLLLQEYQMIIQLLGRYCKFDSFIKVLDSIIQYDNNYSDYIVKTLCFYSKSYFSFKPKNVFLEDKLEDYKKLLKLTEKYQFIEENYDVMNQFIVILNEIYFMGDQQEKIEIEKDFAKLLFQLQNFELVKKYQEYLKNNFSNFEFEFQQNMVLQQQWEKTIINSRESSLCQQSFDFYFLVYFSFEQYNLDCLNTLQKFIDEQNQYDQNDIKLFSNFINKNIILKKIKIQQQILEFFIQFQNKAILLKENDFCKFEPSQILIQKTLMILSLQKENLSLNLQEYFQNLCKFLIEKFSYKLNKSLIQLFLQIFSKLTQCITIINDKDEYIKVILLYLDKFLIIKESEKNFDQNFKYLIQNFKKILSNKDIEKNKKKEFLDKILKIYWILQTDLYKQELKQKIIEYLKTEKLMLSEILIDSERNKRLHKFEFLKEIWNKIKDDN